MDPQLLELHQSLRLGKKAARHDHRTLKMATYTAALAPPPDSYGLPGIPDTTPTLWDNDKYGDCTKASYAGLVYSLSTAAGKPFIYTDDQVLEMYERCDGFNPLDPSSDQGSDGLTTLKYLVSSGADGHAPLAYLGISPASWEEVTTACRYLGGLYLGIMLPTAWQGEQVWDVAPDGSTDGAWAPGSWGGHMIYGKARYTPNDVEILTWGGTYRLTRKALALYSDEIFSVLVPDFKSPDGFNEDQLRQDLASVH